MPIRVTGRFEWVAVIKDVSSEAVLLRVQSGEGMQDPGHHGTDLRGHRPPRERHRLRIRGLRHPRGHLQCLLRRIIRHAPLWDLVCIYINDILDAPKTGCTYYMYIERFQTDTSGLSYLPGLTC